MADRAFPVTGTCPLRRPSSAERSSWGSIPRSALAMGSPVTGRRFDRVEPVGRAAHDEQRDVGSPAYSLHHHDRVDPAAEGDERPVDWRWLGRA